MSEEPKYREQTIHLPFIRITESKPISDEVNVVLNDLFNLTKQREFNEKSHQNLYFYLNPENNEFVSRKFEDDYDERQKTKDEYLKLLENAFDGKSGVIYMREEIFGVETTGGVRSDLKDNERKFKFLQQIPMNKPLQLSVLHMDRFMPQIVHFTPDFD